MKEVQEFFPDGSPIDEWFYNTEIPTIERLGKIYNVRDFGVVDDGKIYTKEMQSLIDLIASNGGGVIVVPDGIYYTGALFFKQGVHLYIAEKGILKGSDDISDYPVCQTRIEGECCLYYPALINADGVDGFTIFGKGAIDGNGLRSWKAFWQRREWNPACTNKDEQRARLLYCSNSKNLLITGVRLQNSQFWTAHFYKCERVKMLHCSVYAPKEPIPSPSTDAVDIDVCQDVLIKGCNIFVNDDAIALKGGKGTWADVDERNGRNERIIVEDCFLEFCHSALTFGSETVSNKNILLRRIQSDGALQIIHFKMREDTPQRHEYIRVEGVEGNLHYNFLSVSTWSQFFDLKERADMPLSSIQNLQIENSRCVCNCFFSVEHSDKYVLSNFTLQNLQMQVKNPKNFFEEVENLRLENIQIKEISHEMH